MATGDAVFLRRPLVPGTQSLRIAALAPVALARCLGRFKSIRAADRAGVRVTLVAVHSGL